MKDKVRVLFIGNYLDQLERPLRYRGILSDYIDGCSPFAMAGDTLPTNLKYANDLDHRPTVLNIRKNLSQMLSHNSENFCHNYNKQPPCKEVKYQNDSEYIIIMNTSIGYILFEKNGIIYSDSYNQNKFIVDAKNDKTYTAINPLYRNDFNWKYYYDKFIDAILSEYNSDHIILIRSNSAQWFMDKQEIKSFDKRAFVFRNKVSNWTDILLKGLTVFALTNTIITFPTGRYPVLFHLDK